MVLILIIILIHAYGVVVSEIVSSKLGPSPRQGSALAYSEKSSQVFIFGGKNFEFLDDLWAFDLKNNTWNVLYSSSQVPGKKYIEKRIKALSFCRQEPEEFCIYGGLGQNSVLNDMWCFYLQSYAWNQEYTKNQPPFMHKFSNIFYKDSEYSYMAVAGLDVFTYTLRFFMYFLFRLDVTCFIWEEIPLDLSDMGIDISLIGFSIIQEREKIIIPVISMNSTLQLIVEYDIKLKSQEIKTFNFTNNQTDFIFGAYFQNSIFLVSETGQIVKINKESDDYDIEILENIVTAYSQSSCTCFGYQCYIFGGQNKDGLHNFLNRIDFSSRETPYQETLVSNYLSPTPRFSHKMEVINGDFWLFGGTDGTSFFNDFWRYNPRKDTWVEIKKRGQYPTPRHSFSSTTAGDLLVIWGGQDKTGLKNDFFIYNTNTNLWAEVPTISQQVPSKRKNACIIFIPPDAYIYGGIGSQGILSDLWRFNFLNNTYTKIDDIEILEQPVCFKYFTNMIIIGIEKMIEFDLYYKSYYKASTIRRPADSIIVSLHNFYVVVGGRVENKVLNTVRSLGLEYNKEFDIEGYLYMSAGVYYNKTIYVFGGGFALSPFFVLPYLPMPRFIKISIQDLCYNDTCTVKCGVGFGIENQECALCPEGSYAYYEYTEYCTKCNPGFYLPNQGGSLDLQCLLCPEGTFSERPGSKYCKVCPPEKYCPIGSTKPLDFNRTSKLLSSQPQFPETYSSDPSSRISTLLFVVYLFVFFIAISTKIRKKVKILDLYSRSHALEEGEYMKIQKSITGGFFTLIFLFLLSLILLYFICEFLYKNTEVRKTLIQKMLEDEEDTVPIVSDFTIDFYLKDYYDRCGNSNPKWQKWQKDTSCGVLIHEEHIGLKGKTALQCKKLDRQICHIMFKCENCTSEMNSYVRVYSDEAINAAKGIIVNVTVGSSIPGQNSSSYSEIVTQKGKSFSGPVGNNFTFTLYPSYYRKFGLLPTSQTGFHVLSMHDSLAGSEFSVENYHEGMRLIINVHLAQSLNKIFIDHSFKTAPLILVCIGIGAISAIFSVVGGFMNAFESAICKKLSIKVANREFSSILNRNAELFFEFQGQDYTKYKSINTMRESENIFLTSGRNSC